MPEETYSKFFEGQIKSLQDWEVVQSFVNALGGDHGFEIHNHRLNSEPDEPPHFVGEDEKGRPLGIEVARIARTDEIARWLADQDGKTYAGDDYTKIIILLYGNDPAMTSVPTPSFGPFKNITHAFLFVDHELQQLYPAGGPA